MSTHLERLNQDVDLPNMIEIFSERERAKRLVASCYQDVPGEVLDQWFDAQDAEYCPSRDQAQARNRIVALTAHLNAIVKRTGTVKVRHAWKPIVEEFGMDLLLPETAQALDRAFKMTESADLKALITAVAKKAVAPIKEGFKNLKLSLFEWLQLKPGQRHGLHTLIGMCSGELGVEERKRIIERLVEEIDTAAINNRVSHSPPKACFILLAMTFPQDMSEMGREEWLKFFVPLVISCKHPLVQLMLQPWTTPPRDLKCPE